MNRLRWVLILAAPMLALVACSGAGTGGGGYGYGAPAAASPSVAPPASAAGGSGGGRSDYGVGSRSPAPAGSVAPGTVQLSGFKFEPATLTVAAGSTVSFANADSVDHTVVQGENGKPAAGQTPVTVSPGKTLALPFASAGTIKLTCTIHPTMNVTVTVTP